MPTATLTSKGQVTIPLSVRQDIGLTVGDQIEFIREAKGKYTLMPKSGSIRELEGCLKWDGPPISLEEMDKAILAGALS